MKKVFKKLKENNFLKASFFSGLAAISKIISAIVIAKVVAILLGPEGLALIGQLSNFVLLAVTLSGVTVSQGIVKYVAEYSGVNDKESLDKLISTGLKIALYSSFIFGFLIIIGSVFLSSKILFDSEYYYIFLLLGITLSLSGVNAIFTSVLNGFKEFKKFNVITILSNLFGLLITIILIYIANLKGVLISLVLNQTILFLVTYFFIRKEKWFSFYSYLKIPFERRFLVDLSKYAILALFSTILVPIVTILIRGTIIKHGGLDDAGYYEFVLRVSNVLVMFFSIIISTYYIPIISEIRTVHQLKREVLNTYKLVIPITILAVGAIYLLRNFIIILLASREFLVVSPYFGWQSLADLFKILSQVLSFILIAKAYIRLAIIIEVLFNSINLILCYFLIPYYGYTVVFKVSFLMYVLYFIINIIIYRTVILKRLPKGDV